MDLRHQTPTAEAAIYLRIPTRMRSSTVTIFRVAKHLARILGARRTRSHVGALDIGKVLDGSSVEGETIDGILFPHNCL